MLAAKLDEQLEAEMRAFRERESVARTDEDHYRARNDFHIWYMGAVDWLNTFLSLHSGEPGPRLKDVGSRASRVYTSIVPEEIAKAKSKEEVLEALEKARVEESPDRPTPPEKDEAPTAGPEEPGDGQRYSYWPLS